MNRRQDKEDAWIKYLLLAFGAGGTLLLAFLLESPYMAYAVYTFLLLLFTARLTSLMWLAGLDCERELDRDQVYQGEEVRVTVRVTNRRGWPIPWVFVEDQYPRDFPCTGVQRRLAVLLPGRSVALQYKLVCPRRAYLPIGPVLLESGDLFGLHKRFRTAERRDYLTVLPTVPYIDTFNVAAKRPQGPVRFSPRIYTDPTRISNIREYVPGDPMNTIHWKATARTGTLHVKTFEPSSVTGGTILLDLHEDSYVIEKRESRMELAITTAAGIAYLLQQSGEQVGLLTNARDAAEVAQYEAEAGYAQSRYEIEKVLAREEASTRVSPLAVPTLRAQGQAQRIIENLARILPGKALDLPALILSQFRGLPRDAALLPITAQITDRLAMVLASMKASGFNVTVFLIDAGKAYREAAAALASHNIHMFHIESERDLFEISPQKI